MNEPTRPQLDYVVALRTGLKLAPSLLDSHCEARFGKRLAGLDRRQVSELIDEMKGWTAIPLQLMREAGQADLPGFGE